jgi:hypothetical protein
MVNREATVEQIAFFCEHGWLVVENAVEPAEIAEVGARMEGLGGSNPPVLLAKDALGTSGKSSARIWRTIRPEEKHPCWGEFVRQKFGSVSALSGSLHSPGRRQELG